MKKLLDLFNEEFLSKYDYPPAEMKEALEIVLRQCEQWTERGFS